MTQRAQRTSLTALVLALCALHVWLAASVSRTFSTTFDEIAHLTAGYAYWTTGDYRFQPENGNFPQRFAALPLLLQDVTFPPPAGEAWRTANVWKVGHAFFHESGNDLPSMLAAARAMNAFLSGALCALIFWWTRELFGVRAGLLALCFAVFCPALLAHGGLVTSDTAATLGFAAASMACWRLLQRATPGRILIAGLCAGLLAISKYSAVLFAPMALLLVAVRLLRRKPIVASVGGRHFTFVGWRRFPALAGMAIAIVALAAGVIWAAYGFRFRAAPAANGDNLAFFESWESVLLTSAPPPPPKATSDHIDLRPGPVQYFVGWARNHRLLPEAWLYGLAFVEKYARGRMAYFMGEYRLTGWPAFFPTAFLLKTTPPALLVIAASMAALLFSVRRRRVWLYRVAPVLVLLAVYWAFSLQSKLNIGHRHLLPTYAALYVLAGAGLLLLRRYRLGAPILVVIFAWHVRESATIRPDYLAYFNAIGHGPEQAYCLFVDSSLDWGQDLPRLRTWLDEHGKGERIFLSYFGTGSPKHAGIDAIRLGDDRFDKEPRPTVPSLTGGIYCLSATMFSRVYALEPGAWSVAHEKAYQQLSAWLRHLRSLPSGTPPTWFDGAPLDTVEVSARLRRYEDLVLGRLCHFLQFRRPDARIGYSILIFRLSDEEAALILNSPPATLELIRQPSEQ